MVRSCKTVVRSSVSFRLVLCVFLLDVFVAPQQETTLASPRRTSRKPLPGPAALRSPSPAAAGRGAQIAKNPITEQTLHRLAAGDPAHRIAEAGEPRHDRQALDGERTVLPAEDFANEPTHDVPERLVGQAVAGWRFRVDGVCTFEIVGSEQGFSNVHGQAAVGDRLVVQAWGGQAFGGKPGALLARKACDPSRRPP